MKGDPELRPDRRELRYAVLAAVNGHPITADEGWAIIRRWDSPDLANTILERDALAARLAAVETWGQQIHDALDGKPLPEYPDEVPARIVALRAELDEARQALAEIHAELRQIVLSESQPSFAGMRIAQLIDERNDPVAARPETDAG